MKDKSKKHDHKGTKLLKLSIFFTIMLAPILAIAFKCAYVTFNKNAYQSYSDNNIVEETIELVNANELIDGHTYNWVYESKSISTSSPQFGFSNLSFNLYEKFPTLPVRDYKRFQIYGTTNEAIWYYYNNGTLTSEYRGQLNFDFSFTWVQSQSTTNLQFTNFNLYTYTFKQQKLDNAFYYAIDEMQESSLFNWTENTAIYTPIQAMTSGLGITTDAISILLTYWMYITLIYIVFDIVIELFTYLTHTLMGQPM